jgi:hypothetical protein
MLAESLRALRGAARRAPAKAQAQLGPCPALQDEVPRLGLYISVIPPLAGGAVRRRAGGDHGGRRRVHHGAGDDLSAGDADQGGHRHLAVPDHLRHRFHHLLHATTNQTVDMLLALLLILGGVIGAQVGTRIGARTEGRTVAHPAGAAGAGGLRATRLRASDAAGRALFARRGRRGMRRALALLALVLSGPVAAEEIVLGLSQDEVAITATFDGSDILIFGASGATPRRPKARRSRSSSPCRAADPCHRATRAAAGRHLGQHRRDRGRCRAVLLCRRHQAPLSEVLSDTEDLRHSVSSPAIRSVGHDVAGTRGLSPRR